MPITFVTGVTPSVAGEADTGQIVNLTIGLSQAVRVNSAGGAPILTLNDGAVATYDAALSPTSGSLVFDYTVGPNDYVSDLEIAGTNLPTSTTAEDAHGVNVDFSSLPDIPTGLQINGSAPVGNVTVSSGHSVIGVTAPNGLHVTALSGGTASDTTLTSGGVVCVSSGGTAIGTTLIGGTEYVYSGGSASACTVLAGVEAILCGGSGTDDLMLWGTVSGPATT